MNEYRDEELNLHFPGEPFVNELKSIAARLRAGEVFSPGFHADLHEAAAEIIAEYGDMAYTDHLTGLASSRYFHEFVVPRLDQFCTGERRRGGPDTYMIAIADLNGLKLINETSGYDAGDALIQTAATRLRQLLRAEDIVTRHGDRADEFIIVMPIDGIGDVFPSIADIIGRRLNSDGLSMAIGFVSLDNYKTVDEALAAVQEVMKLDKATRKAASLTLGVSIDAESISPQV